LIVPVRLKVGCSARSGPDFRAGLQQPPLSSMLVESSTPAIEDRAVEVHTLPADLESAPGSSVPDLIIAATAELDGLTVLHRQRTSTSSLRSLVSPSSA